MFTIKKYDKPEEFLEFTAIFSIDLETSLVQTQDNISGA